MPNVDLPGGTTLYTGGTNTASEPFIQSGVTIPTGRTMANGSKQILVYRIYAYAGGYSGPVTCSLQLGSYQTANFTAPSGTAVSTLWKPITALMTPGTNTFRLNASGRVYIGRSNGGSPELRDNAGNTWSGQAVGQYSYYQAPSAVTSLSHSNILYTSADLDWSAVADNGGTAVNGYRVQVATNSSFTGAVTYNVTTPYIHLTGLVAGTAYWYRVGAKNDVTDEAGTSGVYVWSTFTTLPYSPPSSPRNVAVVASTPTSATIGWTPPASNGGSSVTSYNLRWSLDPTFLSGVTTLPGVTSGVVVTPLVPDTHPYFQVQAVNVAGAGPWSPSVDVDLSGAPSAPPNFVVTSSLPTEVSVAWDIPVDDGGSAITGYRLQRSLSPSFTSPTTVDVGLTPRTYTFTPLAVNTQYYFRVTAKNAATTAGAAFKWSSTLTALTAGVINVLLGGVWVAHRPHVLRTGAWVDLIPHSLDSGVWNPPA